MSRFYGKHIRHTVKKVINFPVPSRDVINQLSLAGKKLIIPAREDLVCDIPAGDGKIDNLFLQCMIKTILSKI